MFGRYVVSRWERASGGRGCPGGGNDRAARLLLSSVSCNGPRSDEEMRGALNDELTVAGHENRHAQD